MIFDANIRVSFIGMTQSGKSHLVKSLLPMYENKLIYDVKGEYASFGVVVRNIEELKRALQGGCNKLVFQPGNLSWQTFDEVCGFVYWQLKNILFVVDEAHTICSKGFIPDNFQLLITAGQGEPRNIGLFAVSQRAQNLHNDILGNSTYWIVFQVAYDDAEYLSRKIKVQPEDLENLLIRHFYVYKNRATNLGENRLVKHEPI